MDFGRSGRKRSGKVCGTGGPLLEAGPGSRWGSCWGPAGWGHLRTSPGTRKTALRLPIPGRLADQDVPALRSPLRLPAVSESHGRRSRGARSSWSQGHCCPPDHPLWLSLDALGAHPRPFPWTLALLGPPFPVGCYPGQNDPLPPPTVGDLPSGEELAPGQGLEAGQLPRTQVRTGIGALTPQLPLTPLGLSHTIPPAPAPCDLYREGYRLCSQPVPGASLGRERRPALPLSPSLPAVKFEKPRCL